MSGRLVPRFYVLSTWTASAKDCLPVRIRIEIQEQQQRHTWYRSTRKHQETNKRSRSFNSRDFVIARYRFLNTDSRVQHAPLPIPPSTIPTHAPGAPIKCTPSLARHHTMLVPARWSAHRSGYAAGPRCNTDKAPHLPTEQFRFFTPSQLPPVVDGLAWLASHDGEAFLRERHNGATMES